MTHPVDEVEKHLTGALPKLSATQARAIENRVAFQNETGCMECFYGVQGAGYVSQDAAITAVSISVMPWVTLFLDLFGL